LQQWPIHIVLESAKNLFGRGAQIHHLASFTQMLSVHFAQDRTPTRGQNTMVVMAQVV
jgi:hypothetical protein